MAHNRRSKLITQGVARSPNRAMLRAVGFGDNDFQKPIVGVANGHSTMNPCNAGIQPLVDSAMKAFDEGHYEEARTAVSHMLTSGHLPRAEYGGPLLVLGALTLFAFVRNARGMLTQIGVGVIIALALDPLVVLAKKRLPFNRSRDTSRVRKVFRPKLVKISTQPTMTTAK